MAPARTPLPTEAELEILRVLWRRGPTTVRDVHTDLSRGRAMGYTTVLKLMQIMQQKGLVRRDESARSHVYRPAPAVDQPSTEGRLIKELMDRAFDGSAASLVMAALSNEKASAEERARIRRLLDSLEDER